MKILVVGCGGRENILCEKLKPKNDIYCIGSWINPDIYEICKHYCINELSEDTVIRYCHTIKPDIVIIGSETLLNSNIVTICALYRYRCIGPAKVLAQLETSKIFTREFLKNNNLNNFNPHYKLLTNTSITDLYQLYDILNKFTKFVIKFDGLAGGKGVFVQDDHFRTISEAAKIIQNNISKTDIVIEEKLVGEEFSMFTLSDGNSCSHLPPIQDYKRAFDKNKGPNTGGMGSVLDDFEFLNDNDIEICRKLNSEILAKIQLKYDMPYIGILYGSFMKTNDGKLKLIEYNCRFGDSEVFNILNCIDEDLSSIFNDMIHNKLRAIKLKDTKSVVKYLVPQGYPHSSECKTISYTKVDNAYASSINSDNKLLGSRAIAVIGEGNDLKEAYDNCENIIKSINHDNLYWRKDIGKIKDAYALAGVDIDKGNEFVRTIKEDVESTYNDNVIGKHGNFGGQYKFNDKVLVASTDGVGTKSILVKKYTGNYYNCGHDIVNHSVNDILVQGATPLFFLDYVASSVLDISDVSSFVKGCCDACKKVNCVLLGGETAEMPSIYREKHIDMVGTIVGEKTIDVVGVEEHDIAIGFPSSGPQTNGYTLIRKILEKHDPPQHILKQLIEPHGSFLDKVLEINKSHIITGMCHITGGGLTENLKRIVPDNLKIDINVVYPEWCKWIQEKGKLSDDEMKKIFNCGIGYIVFIKPSQYEYTSDNIYLGEVSKM
jgi:phosphoribosylamine--glycine ligase/phosphoribosylaminoimidazole synthetase